MASLPARGLENITRSLVPSLLARLSKRSTSFALELTQERLLVWALEHAQRPVPIVAENP